MKYSAAGRIAGVAIALLATAALAATGAEQVKARIDHMKALGGAAKLLGDQMRGGAPDPAVVKAQAANIAAAASALPTWFPKGSGPESGAKTRALPAIWSDASGFSAAVANFQTEAGKMNTAAQAGDMAGVGADMKGLFGGCKGCHDKYRGPENP